MKKSVVKDILEYVVGIVIALIITFSVKMFVIERIRVIGTSMYPTLDDQQTVWVYKLSKIEREDIVIVDKEFHDGRQLIKRVIGMPGDTIIIENSSMTVIDKDGNIVTLKENYHTSTISADIKVNTKLSENEYFVVGDNRAVSLDSTKLGPVPEKMIIGRVLNK